MNESLPKVLITLDAPFNRFIMVLLINWSFWTITITHHYQQTHLFALTSNIVYWNEVRFVFVKGLECCCQGSFTFKKKKKKLLIMQFMLTLYFTLIYGRNTVFEYWTDSQTFLLSVQNQQFGGTDKFICYIFIHIYWKLTKFYHNCCKWSSANEGFNAFLSQ